MTTSSTVSLRSRIVAFLPLLLAAAAVAFPGVGHAFHTTFDNSATRFELDGNPVGAQDGVPDLVDEFDDGHLAPNWSIQFGNPVETGGALHLKNQGTHDSSSLAPWGIVLDRSDILGSFFPCDGGGNFVATASWDPTVPVNNHVVLTFGQASGPNDLETSAIGISNWSAERAAQVPWDAEGYRISQTYVHKTGGVDDAFEVMSVPLDPETVSNPVLLRLSFDDTTNTISTAYSTDGGSTFATPFPARPTFGLNSCGGMTLGADPVSLAPDADGDGIPDETDPCTNVGGSRNFLAGARVSLGRINTDATAGNDTLTLKASIQPTGFFVISPQVTGARVLLQNAAGTVRSDTIIPGGNYHGHGTRGWIQRLDGWKYLDTTGAPIGGITKFEIRLSGGVRVKVVGRDATYPVVTGDPAVKVTLVFGDEFSSQGGECGESVFDASDCSFNRPGTKLRCRS